MNDGYKNSSLVWSDVDLDGHWDLVAMGTRKSGKQELAVYQAPPNLSSPYVIHVATLSLTGGGPGSGGLVVGDLNNDGYPDIAVAGTDSNGNARFLVYMNDHSSLSANANLTWNFEEPLRSGQGLQNAALALGDMNNDGYLDLMVMGQDANGNRPLYYLRNYQSNVIGSTPNQRPPAPNLRMTSPPVGAIATLQWDLPGSDIDHNAMTYEFAIDYDDKLFGGNHTLISSAVTVPAAGHVATIGPSTPNAPLNISLRLRDNATYHVKMRAVDTGLLAGPWSAPVTVDIGSASAKPNF